LGKENLPQITQMHADKLKATTRLGGRTRARTQDKPNVLSLKKLISAYLRKSAAKEGGTCGGES